MVLELEFEVDWVVQSIAAHLEPVVLWVELEVDYVVQNMVVQLKVTFFSAAGLFYVDTFLFLCHLVHPIHVHCHIHVLMLM